MCVQMCCASNWNIPSFIGWGEWRLTSGDHKRWLIQPSFFFLGGGGRGWLGEETQARYPQNENSADLGHYFLGRSQIHFRKNEEMSDLPPAREVPKIIENMTEVDIFDVEEKCAFFMYFSWFWIDYGCVSIQLLEYFGIPKSILKFWT